MTHTLTCIVVLKVGLMESGGVSSIHTFSKFIFLIVFTAASLVSYAVL